MIHQPATSLFTHKLRGSVPPIRRCNVLRIHRHTIKYNTRFGKMVIGRLANLHLPTSPYPTHITAKKCPMNLSVLLISLLLIFPQVGLPRLLGLASTSPQMSLYLLEDVIGFEPSIFRPPNTSFHWILIKQTVGAAFLFPRLPCHFFAKILSSWQSHALSQAFSPRFRVSDFAKILSSWQSHVCSQACSPRFSSHFLCQDFELLASHAVSDQVASNPSNCRARDKHRWLHNPSGA